MSRRALLPWVLWISVLLPARASAADEAPGAWLLLPIHADHPPPNDPTLLRMSESVGRAIAEKVDAPVRLVSREVRDQHCRDDGHRCPDAIARMLDAPRVIALELSDDFGTLTAHVYGRPAVHELTVSTKCKWRGGPVCDVAPIAAKLQVSDRAMFDPAVVDAAWPAVAERIADCFAREKATPAKGATVRFRLKRNGSTTEVRIQPRKLQRKKAYACSARVVEALRLPAFEGALPAAFEKPLSFEEPL